MLLSENKIRVLIRNTILKEDIKKRLQNMLSENEEKNSKWESAENMEASQECYDSIWEHESPVPYVYDDGKKMSERFAIKKYGNIVKGPIIQNIVKKRWPVGKIPLPSNSFTGNKGYPTIGAGHLIKTADEFESYREYTLGSIASPENRNANSGMPLQDFLMSEADMKKLFKKDVDIHTQFKTRITQPITQEMFDALTSIAFNAGWEAKHPKKGYKMPIQYIIELINKKKYKSAQQKILTTATTSAGKSLDGLVARRKDEAKKFGKGGIKPV